MFAKINAFVPIVDLPVHWVKSERRSKMANGPDPNRKHSDATYLCGGSNLEPRVGIYGGCLHEVELRPRSLQFLSVSTRVERGRSSMRWRLEMSLTPLNWLQHVAASVPAGQAAGEGGASAAPSLGQRPDARDWLLRAQQRECGALSELKCFDVLL